MTERRTAGFTLIELLISLAIIGILAAIAYPAYTGYVKEARRADGEAAMMEIAQQLERCYTRQSAYDGCGIAFPKASPGGHYSIRVSGGDGGALTGTAYTLVAVPQGAQRDDACGKLTLDQAGRRKSAGNGDECW